MNSRLNIKKAFALFAALFLILSSNTVKAGDEDNHGLWTSFEMTKKVNKKFKVGAEFEFRTTDYMKEVERYSIGFNCQYKINSWLKASAGNIFIMGYNPGKYKEHFDSDNNELDGYNYDHSYWEKRNRVFVALSGEIKIGRVQISLRERLQYTRTHAEIIDEDKYRFEKEEKILFDEYGVPLFDENWNTITETTINWLDKITEDETKKHKNNMVLRSRLTAKWDIKNCKINPFVSAELYTRLDQWRGFDKLRSRIGASYSINKDNAIEIYYLFEKAGQKGNADTHAIGIGYSLDL